MSHLLMSQLFCVVRVENKNSATKGCKNSDQRNYKVEKID